MRENQFTCEQAEERMAERWIAGLDEAARIELDRHLRDCPACRDHSESLTMLWNELGEWPAAEPSRNARAHFEQMLEAYRLGAAVTPHANGGDGARKRPSQATSWLGVLGGLWPSQPAAQIAMASLALIVGLGAGHFYTARTHDQERISALSAEVHQMRQLVAVSMLQQPLASDRLRGISYSENMDRPDVEVTQALLDTLNHDPNVNVRLAAVDALKQMGSRAEVRRGLRQAVLNQDSPLVQISLIDWAVEAQDRASVDALESLRKESGLNPAVATRLASALDRLQ